MTSSNKCPACDKNASTTRRPLTCSNCKLVFHKKCSKFTQYELSKLLAYNLDWTCEDCLHSLFPFSNIENSEFLTLFSDRVIPVSNNCKTKNKCGKCSKSIFHNFPFFACKKCCNNYHIKCCPNDCMETYCSSPNWECDSCVTQQLPFAKVNNNEFSAVIHGFKESYNDVLSALPSFTIQSLLDQMPAHQYGQIS